MDDCACAHSTIKEVTWTAGGGGSLSSFRCVGEMGYGCWTEFIPATKDVVEAIRQKQSKGMAGL